LEQKVWEAGRHDRRLQEEARRAEERKGLKELQER
jgi:hypothetical protein